MKQARNLNTVGMEGCKPSATWTRGRCGSQHPLARAGEAGFFHDVGTADQPLTRRLLVGEAGREVGCHSPGPAPRARENSSAGEVSFPHQHSEVGWRDGIALDRGNTVGTAPKVA